MKAKSIFCVVLCILFGCATYEQTVQPIRIPELQTNKVEVDGISLVCEVLLEKDEASKRFGFDVRGAGIVPVILTIENKGKVSAIIVTDQTFLVDKDGNGWPILSSEEVYKRITSYTEIGETFKGTAKPAFLGAIAGAVIGAAVAIVSDKNVGESAGKGATIGAATGAVLGGLGAHSSFGEKIRDDIMNKRLTNRPIQPGELVYGVLFFPGKEGEAKSFNYIRLVIESNGKRHVVTLK